MVNKEVAHFIRAYDHCKLLNSCSHEAHQLIQTIDSDTPFDVLFLDFWEPGYILDWDVSHKIITGLYCIIRFGLGAYIGLKEITPDQVSLWDFGKLFVPFWLLKVIVVHADGIFLECSRILSRIPFLYLYNQ